MLQPPHFEGHSLARHITPCRRRNFVPPNGINIRAALTARRWWATRPAFDELETTAAASHRRPRHCVGALRQPRWSSCQNSPTGGSTTEGFRANLLVFKTDLGSRCSCAVIPMVGLLQQGGLLLTASYFSLWVIRLAWRQIVEVRDCAHRFCILTICFQQLTRGLGPLTCLLAQPPAPAPGHRRQVFRRMQYLKRRLLVRAIIASQDEAYKCAAGRNPFSGAAGNAMATAIVAQPI